MAMSIQTTAEPNFLRVHVTGLFTVEVANDCFVRMLEAIAEHGSTKVLVDCRDLIGTLSTMDRYDHAEYAVKELSRAGLAGKTRFAYVSRPPILDNERFGETVARNRGANVKSTDSMEEALGWLETGSED